MLIFKGVTYYTIIYLFIYLFFQRSLSFVHFTGYNVTFSGLISSLDICTVDFKVFNLFYTDFFPLGCNSICQDTIIILMSYLHGHTLYHNVKLLWTKLGYKQLVALNIQYSKSGTIPSETGFGGLWQNRLQYNQKYFKNALSKFDVIVRSWSPAQLKQWQDSLWSC